MGPSRPGKRLTDRLDGFLGVNKPPPCLPARPPTGAPRGDDTTNPLFVKPSLVAHAERLTLDPDATQESPEVHLPPHIHPPANSKNLYERRSASVAPGGVADLLVLDVESDETIYWSAVGTDQHLNSYYEFWVDGIIYTPISGAAQVGTVLRPFTFPGAVRVQKELKLRAYNYNPAPFTYEVVVLGWVVPRERLIGRD